MRNFDKESLIEFLILAGKRALWTFAEVALTMIAIGMPFSEMNWKNIFDVAFGAAIVSVLKSIVVSMPEAQSDGELTITDTTCQMNLEIDEVTAKTRKSVRLRVVPEDENKKVS